MSTCYLCVMGGATMPSPPARSSVDGFGTCHDCDVHACSKHGDRPAGTSFFRCADCLALLGYVAAVTVTAPSSVAGGTGAGTAGGAHANPFQAVLSEGKENALFGLSPRLGAPAALLFGALDINAMRRALVQLGDWLRPAASGPEAAGADFARYFDAIISDVGLRLPDSADGLAAVLGIPVDEEETAAGYQVLAPQYEQREFQNMAGQRVTTAVRLALDEVAGWEFRSPDDTAELATLAGAALAIVYAARGANTLEESPAAINGGLTLPPQLFLLAGAYHAHRG